MSFFWKRKASPEVRRAVEFFEQVDAEFPFETQHYVREIAKEGLKVLVANRETMKVFTDRVHEDYSDKIEQGIKSWVYNYIMNTAADEMESGNHHVYRGILNMFGEYYQSIFEHGIEKIIDLGECSKEWADEKLRKPVYGRVKTVG